MFLEGSHPFEKGSHPFSEIFSGNCEPALC